ncbi:DUF3137 domain-containing protein [Ferruginibacter sp.]|nr:DUF3137 domain-containing protein [Ferruginibacter sp.]
MDEVKNFEDFYTVKLQPLINNLKTEAGAAGNWGIIALVIAFVTILIFVGYQVDYIHGNAGMAIFLCIAAIAISIYFYTNRKEKYTKDYKETIIKEIITYLHPGITYKPDEVIAKQEYKFSGLFRRLFDYYDGDDYMEGIYKDVVFRCSELHTQYERLGTGITGSRLITIFKGLFFVAEISKHFTAGTYIWSHGDEQTGGSIADERYRLMHSPNVYKIKLQNCVAGFENVFSVYSTNPSEVGSILTTAMTERLIKFKQQIDREIAVSFVAGRCYVAIAINEELLEPSGFDTDDREEVKQYFFTVLLILSIINQLQLNRFQ